MAAGSDASEVSGVPGAAGGIDAPTAPSIGAFPAETQTQILSHLNVQELISLRASCRNYRDIVSNDCHETWKRLHDAQWYNGKRKAPTAFQEWSKMKGWSAHPEEIVGGNWYKEFVRRSRLDRGVIGRLRALNVEQSQGNEVWYGLMADGEDILDSVKKVYRPLLTMLGQTYLLSAPYPLDAPLIDACQKVLTGISRCVRYQEWRFLTDTTTAGGYYGARLEEGAIAIANFYDESHIMMESNYPFTLNQEAVGGRIDELVDFVEERLSQRSSAPYPIREVLEEMKLLFEPPGAPNYDGVPIPFTGNQSDYYNHCNSLINHCIWDRTGIPLTLSIVYVAIVRRVCDADLDIIGLPGHIVVGVPSDGIDNASRIFVDPFHQGRILSHDDCRDIVARYGLDFHEDMIRPISNREIWQRILRNLLHCHSQEALADDASETSDPDHQWKIVLPLTGLLSDKMPTLTNLRLLMAAPGWCPQYC